MTTEIKDEIYSVGIWYVAWKDADWMAWAGRPKDGGPWSIKYRFRYYSQPESGPFDDKDRKSWYAFQASPDTPEKEIEDGLEKLARIICLGRSAHTFDIVKVKACGYDAFSEAIKGKPWFSVKTATAEELKKYGLDK